MGITNFSDFGSEKNLWTDHINPEKQPVSRTILTKSAGKIQPYFLSSPETHRSQENLHLVIKEDEIDLSSDPDGRSFHFKRLNDGALGEEKGKNLIVHVPPISSPPLLSTTILDASLCAACTSIDLKLLKSSDQLLHHRATFVDLRLSAQTCPLCALLMSSLPHWKTLTFDETRFITIRASSDRGRPDYVRGMALNSLLIDFPTKERGFEGMEAVRRSSLTLTTNYNSHAAFLGDVTGRRIGSSFDLSNLDAVFEWLSECFTRHPNCSRIAERNAKRDFRPARLINVGFSDVQLPSLVDCPVNDRAGPMPSYLALSYQWGEAVSLMTKKSNLESHKRSIPLDNLCHVFRDAINLTQKIGYRYIWIDALCIVQDSEEDLYRELKCMGHIYSNAAMTLAASVSGSGQARLLEERGPTNEVMLPFTGCDLSPPCEVFVTNRRLTDFGQDVTNGNLSHRAWCLQERAMSRRILHFGRDQLFWECLTGVWSEGSSMRLGANGKALDEISKFRDLFQTLTPANNSGPARMVRLAPPIGVVVPGIPSMQDRSHMIQIRERKPYGPWYGLVEQYTKRVMKYESDKLPAIMGLARKFAEELYGRAVSDKEWEDVYTAGLWDKDVAAGLLWSAGHFHRWDVQHVRLAATRRAPSWSWASVDGPIAYPDGFISGYKIEATVGIWRPSQQPDPHKTNLTIGILGSVLPLERAEGFRRKDRSLMTAERTRFERLGPFRMAHVIFDTETDAKIWEETSPLVGPSGFARPSRDQYTALLVAQIGCGAADCRHYANCEPNLAYALILKPAEGGNYKRAGIAQVKVAQFLSEAKEEYIEIV